MDGPKAFKNKIAGAIVQQEQFSDANANFIALQANSLLPFGSAAQCWPRHDSRVRFE